MTLAEMAAALVPVLGAIGGAAKWLAGRADAATAATERRIAALEAARDAAQAAFMAFAKESAAASEARTEKVVTAIGASTTESALSRAAIGELRGAVDRAVAAIHGDGRTTSERIAGGPRDAVG